MQSINKQKGSMANLFDKSSPDPDQWRHRQRHGPKNGLIRIRLAMRKWIIVVQRQTKTRTRWNRKYINSSAAAASLLLYLYLSMPIWYLFMSSSSSFSVALWMTRRDGKESITMADPSHVTWWSSNCPGIDSKAPTHQPTAQHLRFTFHAISLSRVSLVHHHPRENKIYCVWGFIRCGFLFCCSSNYFLLRRRRFLLLLLLDMSQLWICEWVSESLIDYIGVRNLIGIGTWAGPGIDTQQQPKHVPINNYISAVIESVIHIIRCHEEDRRT